MTNKKVGFIFYNIDTDRYQDKKIKRLKKNLGCNGLAIYDYILCEIYRVKGCFIEWDEDTVFDVAEYLEIKESLVKEVVNYCCCVGLFNKELLDSGNVLSSISIQKRFLEMSKRAKRVGYFIPENINLLEDTPKLPDVQVQPSGSLPHSRVEYSKEEKSKVSISRENLKTEKQKVFELFYWKNIKNPKEESDRFWNHYSSSDWKDKNGNFITNKLAKSNIWTPNIKSLATDPIILNKWQQVYNLMLENHPDKRKELLNFTPKYIGERLCLTYLNKDKEQFKISYNIIENEMLSSFKHALSTIFGQSIKLEYKLL